jgi:hypothetical protein
MGGLQEWYAGFDLGEFLGIGLDTAQIAHLAGALFLALFSLAALRRAKGAAGLLPAVWITVSVALLAGAFLIAARGFPDEIPDEAKPFTEPDRLTRAAAVVALLGCSLVLFSANWSRAPLGRFVYRVAGLATAGLAVWLGAGWFGDQVPEEVRDWTAQEVITRIVVVLALLCLAGAFWVRQAAGSPHSRWLNRSLSPPALAIAALLALKWFGPRVPVELPTTDIRSVTLIVAAIATGTCIVIAVGAYLLRERTPSGLAESRLPAPPDIPPPRHSAVRLPVATMLDEHGRPVLPASSAKPGHAGPAGA